MRPLTVHKVAWLAGLLAGFCVCGGDSKEGGSQGVVPLPAGVEPFVDAVDVDRYRVDLDFIARPRPPGSPHWQAVQDLCTLRLNELGYDLTRQDYGSGSNVIGTRLGAVHPEQIVLISAHYDHIDDCAGADDNATGVAGLMEAARVLATAVHDRTLVVACWDEEERGLVGSLAYAREAEQRDDNILAAYVFEMIGYKSDAPDSQQLPEGMGLLFSGPVAQVQANDNRGNFIAVIYDEHGTGGSEKATAWMGSVAEQVGLPLVALRVPSALKQSELIADLRRSDHDAFWLEGYPAMMITDTANFRNPNYHCTEGPDTVDTLDHGFAAQVVQATVGSAAAMLRAGS